MVVTTGLLGLFFGLAVVLFALFCFLIDGKRLITAVYELSPVPCEFVERVMTEFWEMTKVMVKITVIIGVLQGVTGGIGLWLAGTPRVFMWTIVMIFLSIMPVLGAMGVLLPTIAVYAFVLNDYQAALIVTVTLVVVTVGDNFLKPILVGKDMALPGSLVLLGAVVGIPLFGLFGFLYGPITLAAPMAYLDVYTKRRDLLKEKLSKRWQPFTPRFSQIDRRRVAKRG
jgi:Predicted permease